MVYMAIDEFHISFLVDIDLLLVSEVNAVLRRIGYLWDIKERPVLELDSDYSD